MAVDERNANVRVEQVLHSESVAHRRHRLVTPPDHERLRRSLVHRAKPLDGAGHDRKEQDPSPHPPNLYAVPLEPILLRQPYRLATALPEQFGDSDLGKGGSPSGSYRSSAYTTP